MMTKLSIVFSIISALIVMQGAFFPLNLTKLGFSHLELQTAQGRLSQTQSPPPPCSPADPSGCSKS